MTEDQARYRPIWLRVVQSPLLRPILLGSAMFFFMGWAQSWLNDYHAAPLTNLAIQIVLAAAAIGLYIGYGRMVERRAVTELATPGLAREWALGALCGAGLYTACAVILMGLGIYQVEGLNPLVFLLPNLAIAVAGAVFGLVHLANPGATLGGAIYISIEAGILLSAAYLVTRRLWICIGFHMAWNYFQSAVFSGAVSGAVSDPGLLKARIEGPDWLTGGSFGMEHSVVALVLCTTAGMILLRVAMRRGHMVPLVWTR